MSTSDHFTVAFAQVPEELRQKVNGDPSEEGFRFVGWELFKSIQRTLAVDQNLFKATRILDLGSGLGRLTLPLLQGAPQAEITAVEKQVELLAWSQKLLKSPRLHFASDTEPLASGSFELILAISFFTQVHQSTDYWLSEVDRLLSEDGVAFISYQDEKLFRELKAKGAIPETAECRECYVSGEGNPVEGPHLSVFHKSTHWQSLLSRHFEVMVINPRGLFGHQSISVIRRRKEPRFDREKLRQAYKAQLQGLPPKV